MVSHFFGFVLVGTALRTSSTPLSVVSRLGSVALVVTVPYQYSAAGNEECVLSVIDPDANKVPPL